jgi:hypothetical protein
LKFRRFPLSPRSQAAAVLHCLLGREVVCAMQHVLQRVAMVSGVCHIAAAVTVPPGVPDWQRYGMYHETSHLRLGGALA